MKNYTRCLAIAFASSVLVLVCGGCDRVDDDSRAPKVIGITPAPGTWIDPSEEFTLRFNTPVIPNSGSITFASSPFRDYTFRLPYSDPSDTVTWNRCHVFAPFHGEQNQLTLIVRDFRDVNDQTQAKAFRVSYNDPPAMAEHRPGRSLPAPAFILDPDPPKMIEYQPSGSRVDPAVTREIRATFNDRVFVKFEIDPPIDGTPDVTYDHTQCVGIARWVFADTEKLRYATNYRVLVQASDAGGTKVVAIIRFTTKE